MIKDIFDYIDKYGTGTAVFQYKKRTLYVNHHDKEQLFSIAWLNEDKIQSTIRTEDKFFEMLNKDKWKYKN